MADNDQNNDEYKFDEFDSLNNQSMADFEPGAQDNKTRRFGSNPDKKNIKKNAAVVLIVVVLLMIGYKLFGYFFSEKPKPVKEINPVVQAQIKPIEPLEKIPSVVTPQPIQQSVVHEELEAEIKQKVYALDLGQSKVMSQVSTLNDQVGVMTNHVNQLNAQVDKLSQVLENLSKQVAIQSNAVSLLMARAHPKPPVRRLVVSKPAQVLRYFVQAVVPGRAWLIGSNGSTLTVREGTKIPGYGMVRLIDSTQGRVLTSSGQVIRFSQEDS